MKPPPLLLGAALLFWGWRADMLAVGAIAAGLIEISNGVKGRWEFTDKEFNRLWDVCTVLFMVAAVYLRFSEDVTSAAYKFFQWMPLIFYPMALGYVFSTRDGVPMKAFSWFMRRQGASGADRPIAFGWVYFTVCVISAGSTNDRDIWYYFGFALLTGWALWSVRPRRVPEWAWAVMFLAVAVGGFFGQARMQDLQAYFEMKASELFVKFGRREFDPGQSRTAMGRIGALKQSGRIVLKVKSEAGTIPERLRQASYTRLEGAVWRGGRGQFEQVPVEPDLTTWTLTTNQEAHSAIRVIERVHRKSALLSVPAGTVQLRELAVGKVETNHLGAVRALENPGLLDYTAHHGRAFWERPPSDSDYDIPDDEEMVIERLAEELAIDALAPHDKLPAIEKFFQEKFKYTTYQKARELGLHAMTPLEHFLTKTRAGHCEYFASATVLLLRQYDIPARYATGYAVQERSKDDGYYIVRERHGHAWAMAYLGGKWIEVDSTPADWEQAEREEFPMHQNLKDAWERFTFSFMEWRWLGDWGVVRMVAPFLAVPLIAFLGWRIFGRRMFLRPSRPRDAQVWPGADSEFFALEKRLARAGLTRENHETTAEWLQRVASDFPGVAETLRNILRIHYKYRFDPEGIEASERDQLRQMVRACLARL
jgi:transglutaminase-like putative cysteine protease